MRHMKQYLRIFCAAALLLALLCGCAEKTADFQPAEGSTEITLRAVGDIMIDERQMLQARQPDGSYDFSDYYLPVAELLGTADLTLGNLETTFAGEPYSAAEFSAPDALAACLAGLGFDVLQTANSRSIQNGISGLTRTKQVLTDAGIAALGTFATEDEWKESGGVLLREVNGVRIALIGMTKGLSNMRLPENAQHSVNLLYTDYDSTYASVDTAEINRLLKNAKALEPDLTVAMLHWGSEEETAVSQTQEEITELLISGGVDVILGSHSHRVGRIEQRSVQGRNVVIAYGLGDFSGAETERESIALELTVTKDSKTGVTRVTKVDYTPLYLTQTGVYDIETALALYDSDYVGAIDEAQYATFSEARERLRALLQPEETE